MSRQFDVPLPQRMRHLPRNPQGYVIPWFVATQDDGTRDFRIIDPQQMRDAVRWQICWICGQRTGQFLTFTIGPMCAVNRITAEPPSHRECAEYAVQVCPFMVVPHARRRTTGLPEDRPEIVGIHSDGNPGVSVTWTTRSFTIQRVEADPAHGVVGGELFKLGDPVPASGRALPGGWDAASVEWWHEGRRATRAAAEFALESGLGRLREACLADDDPVVALGVLEVEYQLAKKWLPGGMQFVSA